MSNKAHLVNFGVQFILLKVGEKVEHTCYYSGRNILRIIPVYCSKYCLYERTVYGRLHTLKTIFKYVLVK